MKNTNEFLAEAGIKESDYFGPEDWKKLLPTAIFCFPKDIKLPQGEDLDGPGIQKNKHTARSMRESLSSGDYFIFVIPRQIDGSPVTLELLKKLMPEKFTIINHKLDNESARAGLWFCLKDQHAREHKRTGGRGPETVLMPKNHLINNTTVELVKRILYFAKNGTHMPTEGFAKHMHRNYASFSLSQDKSRLLVCRSFRCDSEWPVSLAWQPNPTRWSRGESPNKALVRALHEAAMIERETSYEYEYDEEDD